MGPQFFLGEVGRPRPVGEEDGMAASAPAEFDAAHSASRCFMDGRSIPSTRVGGMPDKPGNRASKEQNLPEATTKWRSGFEEFWGD